MTDHALSDFHLPAEHEVFAGHFPGHPLVPGAMLLDWVLRECARHISRPAASPPGFKGPGFGPGPFSLR